MPLNHTTNKVIDCDPKVSEFEFQCGYYVHFLTNILERGMTFVSAAISSSLPSVSLVYLGIESS